MKKSIFTIVICAALVVGGFFGAKAIISREKNAQAEGLQAKNAQTEAPLTEAPQTQQSGNAEMIWYQPSDGKLPRADYWSRMNELSADDGPEHDSACRAANAVDRVLSDNAPDGYDYPDWFGGCWIGNDNKVHFAFTVDADENVREMMRSELSAYSNRIFYENDMPYSYNELDGAREKVYDYLIENEYKYTWDYVDERYNCIGIGILKDTLNEAETEELLKKLEALFHYPIVIDEGEHFQAQ